MIVAEEFLEYSKELYKNQNSGGEIILRNAARNAYYALFHKLSSIELKSIQSADRNYGSHELLIQKLRSSDKIKYRELGLLLSSLKCVRTRADYHLQQSFSDHDAYSTIRKVEKVFGEFAKIESAAPLSPAITTKEEIKELTSDSNTNCPPKLSIVK